MADREWYVDGVQVYESGTEEYYVDGVQLSEDQAVPAGGLSIPVAEQHYRQMAAG